MLNKKGYYRFADVGMFVLCFTIIAVGIGIGIYIFYFQEVDIRGLEARVLFDKLARGIMDDGLIDIDNYDIFLESGLDIDIINSGYFYFNVEILREGNLVKSFVEGNREFEVECGLNSKKFPRCYPNKGFREFIVNGYQVRIMTASNQFGVRI